jgi:hypothetical protein
MPTHDNALITALAQLAQPTNSNELAFLALTSKVELPIRDRLSFALAQMRQGEGDLVAREWKERVDLAILSSTREPKALVELKCMYSFNLFNAFDERRFKSAVERDRSKLKRLIQKHHMTQANPYVLVLVTHPLNIPKADYTGVIKYLNKIKRIGEKTSAEVTEKISSSFGNCPVATGCIPSGRWFNTNVEVHYALYRVCADA